MNPATLSQLAEQTTAEWMLLINEFGGNHPAVIELAKAATALRAAVTSLTHEVTVPDTFSQDGITWHIRVASGTSGKAFRALCDHDKLLDLRRVVRYSTRRTPTCPECIRLYKDGSK